MTLLSQGQFGLLLVAASLAWCWDSPWPVFGFGIYLIVIALWAALRKQQQERELREEIEGTLAQGMPTMGTCPHCTRLVSVENDRCQTHVWPEGGAFTYLPGFWPACRSASMTQHQKDIYWMEYTIRLAKGAGAFCQRPFATVIVNNVNQLVDFAVGSELPVDPTRHSEMVAIRRACNALSGLLQGCTMYQTHEPCHMCCGAIKHAKISRVVWGSSRADLPQLFRGCNISAVDLLADTSCPPVVEPGFLRDACIALFDTELARVG